METISRYFKGIISIVCTAITWLFGAWDTPLCVLALFMALDYVTGILKAYINKELSSNIGFHGIARKAAIFIVLIVAVALDRLLNIGNWLFRSLVCYFYIANEGLSLLENCAGLGLPIPDKLLDALVQLKNGNKEGC